MTVSAPARIARIIRCSVCHLRVSANVVGPVSMPEHSVKNTRLPAWMTWFCASGSPA